MSGNYLTIQDWMVSKLNLKGVDLIVYAIIYGFSQDGKSFFNGGQNYLAFWSNSTVRGVQKSLKKLIERGLISKNEYGYNTNSVRIDDELSSQKHELCSHDTHELSSQKSELCSEKHELSSPNNIDNISIKEKEINKEKEKSGFKKPSLSEIYEYCQSRNNGIDAQEFFDFYQSKNWMVGKNKMSDWRAAVRTWEHKRKDQKPSSTNPYATIPYA